MGHDLAISLIDALIDAFDQHRDGTATEPFHETVERSILPLLPPERVTLVGQLTWIASAALHALPADQRRELLETVAGIDNLSPDGRTAAHLLGRTFHASTPLDDLGGR